jgi:predicted RNase H-like HicB family nuclease
LKKKKITAVIEASKTGFGIYSDDLPGITGYGDTIEQAREDIIAAMQAARKYYISKKATPPTYLNIENIKWEYQYDFASLFNYFPLDATAFANSIGINSSLLRQYKTGHAKASDKQKKKIENGLHDLGRQLLEVKL